MPIIERDSWRQQYFENVPCPEDVVVPTDDRDAYGMFPKYHHVYNRLFVAESQGLECAPHGIKPDFYPVFSKPTYNLKGMGLGARELINDSDYSLNECSGYFWSQFLTGKHISTDCAVLDGKPLWWGHAWGVHVPGFVQFAHWEVGCICLDIEQICADWISKHLVGYTGMVNLETIGGLIIEVHLRFTDQWPDLAEPAWLDAIVGLYQHGQWNYSGRWESGYSVMLHGRVEPYHPPKKILNRMCNEGAISVQITYNKEDFRYDREVYQRIAVVNCFSLKDGERACDVLAEWYISEREKL